MLDIGMWHEINLEDSQELKFLSQLDESFSFLAKRILENNSKETRALLFDALLERDKKVYTRRDLSKVLNPYR